MEITRRLHKRSTVGIETRDDGKTVLTGHAAVFNEVASGGWFNEQVAPGAFKESLQEDDVRALWNHNTEIVMGRNRAGTLKLWEDDRGLAVEIYPPDTQQMRDYIATIERGDVTQMSFGFIVKKVAWEEGEDGEEDLRTIEKVELWEVSPVTFPFYRGTDIGVDVKAEYRSWRESIAPIRPYKARLNRRRLNLRLR